MNYIFCNLAALGFTGRSFWQVQPDGWQFRKTFLPHETIAFL